MKQLLARLISLSALLATGCGTRPAATPVAPTPLTNLNGNWQIQSGPPAPPNPTANVLLLGALQNTGAQVTGTFRYSELTEPVLSGCALNQVVTVTGTLDASGNLALTSAALPDGSIITVQLLLPSVLTNIAQGTIAVAGKNCPFASAAAIGGETAPVTGAFSGPLTPAPSGPLPNGPSGSAMLTLTQSAMPAADGQFPVTGSLAYAFGSCAGSVALSGTASGVGLTLSSIVASPQLHPDVRVVATVTPTASQIMAAELLFAPFACAADAAATASYTGTLTRQ